MSQIDQKIKEVGSIGENIAANYLLKNGYEILDANFFNELGYRRGEIDIVAKDPENNELVFVEVKARKMSLYSAQPELAITKSKYRKLLKIISSYINKNNLHDQNWRLDAIAIEMDVYSRKARLKHLKYIYY
jgi:putative endonuclease